MSVLTAENPGFTGNPDADQLIILNLPILQLINLRKENEYLQRIIDKDSFWRDRIVSLYGEDVANAKPSYNTYRMQNFFLEFDLNRKYTLNEIIKIYKRLDALIVILKILKDQGINVLERSNYYAYDEMINNDIYFSDAIQQKYLIDILTDEIATWLVDNGYIDLISLRYSDKVIFRNDQLRKRTFELYEKGELFTNFSELFALGNLDYINELLSLGYTPEYYDFLSVILSSPDGYRKHDNVSLLQSLESYLTDDLKERLLIEAIYASTYDCIEFLLKDAMISNVSADAALNIGDKRLLLRFRELGVIPTQNSLFEMYFDGDINLFNWLMDEKFLLNDPRYDTNGSEYIDDMIDIYDKESYYPPTQKSMIPSSNTAYRLELLFNAGVFPSQNGVEKLANIESKYDNGFKGQNINLLNVLLDNGMTPRKYPNVEYVRDWMWKNGLLNL